MKEAECEWFFVSHFFNEIVVTMFIWVLMLWVQAYELSFCDSTCTADILTVKLLIFSCVFFSRIKNVINQFEVNMDVELQQRGVEFGSLFKKHNSMRCVKCF